MLPGLAVKKMAREAVLNAGMATVIEVTRLNCKNDAWAVAG